jgi:Zn-dependent protease with chaperone function
LLFPYSPYLVHHSVRDKHSSTIPQLYTGSNSNPQVVPAILYHLAGERVLVMRRGSWWKSSLYPLLLILALLGSDVCVRAQSSSDDVDDEEKPAPSLNLSIVFSDEGKAQVNFFAFGQPSTASEIKTVLEASLGCTLQDKTPFQASTMGYRGSCEPLSLRSSAVREFKIATAPLRKFAQTHQIEQLNVTVRLPDVEITETQPAIQTQLFSVGKMSATLQRISELNHPYFWHTDSAIPDFVTVRFGFSSKSVARTEYILLGVLLFPLLLTSWMGRKALNSEAQDKAVVWFTYMRYLGWTLNLALLSWWIAADSLHLVQLLQFLSASTRISPIWDYAITPTIIRWFPPAIIWVLCLVLSHPVQEKLRGLAWTRGELAMQGFYSCCASLLPLALFLTGLSTIARASLQIGVLWMVAAFAVSIVASRARQKALGMQPHALTTGDLRDRAFAMARQLGVKLQQIYIIPSGKGQMANAFARKGNVISFTDFLLQRMSRREVNYVLGHELSHLKLGHPGKLAMAAAVCYFVAITSVGFAQPFLHLSVVPRYALIVAIVTLGPYFWSRRFEYAADAGAVEVTGDPEAAISALFKLAQLNMLPIHWSNWSEKWLTHPSSLRRAQAIARKAGIPMERISDIAQTAAAADDHYVLPDTVTPGVKVHSTHTKQGGSLRVAFTMLALLIFTPAASALLANRFLLHSPFRGALFLAGFASTIAMYYACANFLPPMRLPKLVASLKTKLAREGIQAEAWDGVFVGFSPAAAPRSYEQNINWDLGCLFVRSDRLCYWGEETKFSLRPDQITAITVAPGLPGLLPPRRIYMAWKDDDLGTSGVFNIGCINGVSTLRLREQTAKLAERLKVWWKSTPAVRPLPGPLAALRSPELGPVTGVVPRWRAGKVFNELFLTTIFAIVGAILCGLPFHLMAFFFAQMIPAVGKVTPFHGPGSGWYVVGVVLVVRFLAIIPALRYKDQAIVTLAPSRAQASRLNVAPSVPSETRKVENNKVFSH